MTRLLCTGDWHVGSGLDYGRTPADRLADQEAVIEKIVDLSIEHDVDALLLAGDFWHRRRPTPAELMAVARPLRRLAVETNIDVLAIAGNHCVESADLPIGLELLEDIVDVHRAPGIWNTRGCAVATLPWTPVSRLVAARGDGDRDDVHAVAAQLLVETARDLRAQIDGPAVLMLHWSVSGASTPTGVMTDDFRETVLPADDLVALGFDAIVCGHIHKAQYFHPEMGWHPHIVTPDGQVTATASPPFFYTGSPTPVDFGEADVPHGVWLLDVGNPEAPAGVAWAQFLPIESRPFKTLDAHLGDGDDFSMLTEGYVPFVEQFADAVVRVRYTATEEQARRISHAEITKALYDVGAHKVYSIQPTIERENRARVEHVNEDIAPLAAVDAWCDANLPLVTTKSRVALGELTSTYLQEVGTA